MVTPPICFAAFTAASLAGGDMMKTGVVAFRIALAGQLVPFYFALNPGLLMIGSTMDIAIAVFRASVGLIAAGLAFEVFRLWSAERDATQPRALIYLRRIIFLAAAILLIFPSTLPTIAGAGLIVIGAILVFTLKKSQA